MKVAFLSLNLSHKNDNIVYKHGSHNTFYPVILHFHGCLYFHECLISKGIQNNSNDFKQRRFFYEEDLDAALAIIDTNMFENDEDME